MTTLSRVGEIVRRHDPDRFLTALFAPAAHRETLFALYAFNHELARAREAVREPMAALIRLQWWREVVEGRRMRHEVAGPLGEALDAGRLDPALLGGMIDAREAETEEISDLAAFDAYVEGTAGALMVAAAKSLGMPDAETLRRPGAAYGVAGVLRSVIPLARQGRCMLPEDVLAAAGLSGGAVVAGVADAGALAGALEVLAAHGRRKLLPRPIVAIEARAAVLPLVLARRDLRRRHGWDVRRGLGDRLAVTCAAFTGRC